MGFSFFQESLSVDTIKSQVGEPIESIRRDSYLSMCRAHLVTAEKILVAVVPTECWLVKCPFLRVYMPKLAIKQAKVCSSTTNVREKSCHIEYTEE